MLKLKDESKFTSRYQESLKKFNIPAKRVPISSLSLVRWHPLDVGRIKLNYDRSCIGNPSVMGAGEVLCDHQDKLMVVYSYYFGDGTNNEIKIFDLLTGL